MPSDDALARMTISEVLEAWPQVARLLTRRRMACPGCAMAPFMTLADSAAEYGVPLRELLESVRHAARSGA